MRDGERAAHQYDAMAQAYAADNEESAFNAYYERPAMISLLGEVKGRRVLELGCGAGPLTAWLVEHGAKVTACDVSPAMAELARGHVGERANLLVADIAETLPFPDRGFELVVASLVLHYLKDWDGVLEEVRRVVEPEGTFVFSTHHPTMDWPLASPEDYFVTRPIDDVWEKGGHPYEVSYWRRPLTAMCEAIRGAGFSIDRLVEPMPTPSLEGHDPAAFGQLTTRPQFLFFVLRPVTGEATPRHDRRASQATDRREVAGAEQEANTGVAISTITVDCIDPARVARFWMDLLGYEKVPNFKASIAIGDPSGAGPNLLFADAGGQKAGKNRWHLDLRPADQRSAVRRAEALGARRVDIGQGDDTSWVVLADPEGNEFCLLQSRADYERFRREQDA